MNTITEKQIKSFEMHLREEEKSDNTVEKYIRDIRFFREWLGGRAVDKSAVLEYKKELCGRYMPRSVNSILSSLNSFFMYMNRFDMKVKTIKIQRRIFSEQEKELTKEEYERLLTAAMNKNNQRLYYLMQTIGSTGIRVSELQFITCEAVNKGCAVINCKGKIRYIFLPGKLCRMLKSYIKMLKIKSGPIFITNRGNPLDRSAIWKMLKTLSKNAKVAWTKIFPHNFRHLFARTFYSIQKDIVRLADLLGHSSIETTRLYTMESGKIHRMQIERLNLLRC